MGLRLRWSLLPPGCPRRALAAVLIRRQAEISEAGASKVPRRPEMSAPGTRRPSPALARLKPAKEGPRAVPQQAPRAVGALMAEVPAAEAPVAEALVAEAPAPKRAHLRRLVRPTAAPPRKPARAPVERALVPAARPRAARQARPEPQVRRAQPPRGRSRRRQLPAARTALRRAIGIVANRRARATT
jgi:hypothetical protein